MKRIHKVTVALLSVVAVSIWNTTFATSSTIDVRGTVSESHSEAISVGTLTKTNAGSLALSGTNATGNLNIQGGLVSVSAASNLNGASSVVTFAASGNDPLTTFANTATLEIAGTMNTGALTFSTDGTVQVDSSYEATLDHAPTGTGLLHKTGAGVMKVASDLSASNTLAGIHVDNGTFYVQSGKAPVAPIQIASGAALQLAGVDDSAESQISSAITVQSGGSIVVDANVDVGSALSSTLTYTFDTNDGYYKNGVARIDWPSNLTGFISLPTQTWVDLGISPLAFWLTSDTTSRQTTYGGVWLLFTDITGNPLAAAIMGNYVYYATYDSFAATTPTLTGSTGMDAALSGTVLMESGSKLVLGAGSTWARDITVVTASSQQNNVG